MSSHRLRVALVSMYFEPEFSGSAPYTTDVARCYAGAGHKVSVLTTWPHYPQWQANRKPIELESIGLSPEVNVRRLRTYVPRNPTLLRRLLYEVVFDAQVICRLLLGRRFDVICGCTPNLFSAVAAALVGCVSRRPVIQFVQDVVSSALTQTDQGGRSLAGVLRWLEGWALRHAAIVVVPTPAFKKGLQQLGVSENRVRVIRNWTHLGPLPLSAESASPGVILHTGNIGQKQSLDLLAPAISNVLGQDERLSFRFVGDGNRREELVARLEGVARATVEPPVAADQYPALLQEASVLLVHERPGVLDMSLPSKLTSYFASGRPVVAVVAEDGVTADEIRASGAGVVVGHDDPQALIEAIRLFVDDPARAATFGANGKEYAERFLSPQAAYSALESVLLEACGNHARR
jgi:colanic acid biosynthesis glycosyl transferase WcaI